VEMIRDLMGPTGARPLTAFTYPGPPTFHVKRAGPCRGFQRISKVGWLWGRAWSTTISAT
jgi:hypothetical protein